MSVKSVLLCPFKTSWVRLPVVYLVAVVIGVLSNALVTNITRDGKVDWSLLWSAKEFQGIAVVTVIGLVFGIVGEYFDAAERRRVEEKMDQYFANMAPQPRPAEIKPLPQQAPQISPPHLQLRASKAFDSAFKRLSPAEQKVISAILIKLESSGLSLLKSASFVHQVQASGETLFVIRIGRIRVLLKSYREGNMDCVMLNAIMKNDEMLG